MKKRLTTALAAGAAVAAIAAGVAAADQGGVPIENGCTFPVGAYISSQAMKPGSNAGPNSGAFPWTNNIGAPAGVPDAPGQNVKYRCIFWGA